MSIDLKYISSTITSLLHYYYQWMTDPNNLIEAGIIITGILFVYLTYRPINKRLYQLRYQIVHI